jgi:hypothetical protein
VVALIQGDIQTTMPDTSVLVARPTVYDLGALIRTLFTDAASAIFSFEQFNAFMAELNAVPESERQKFISEGTLFDKFSMVGRMAKAVQHIPLPALTHAGALLQQASLINWSQVLETLKQSGGAKQLVGSISLAKLYEFDSTAIDRAYGVCPVPLYQLEEKDWDLFLEGRRIDEVQEKLKSLNIFQYFFPPPDQLALAVAERGIPAAHGGGVRVPHECLAYLFSDAPCACPIREAVSQGMKHEVPVFDPDVLPQIGAPPLRPRL